MSLIQKSKINLLVDTSSFTGGESNVEWRKVYCSTVSGGTVLLTEVIDGTTVYWREHGAGADDPNAPATISMTVGEVSGVEANYYNYTGTIEESDSYALFITENTLDGEFVIEAQVGIMLWGKDLGQYVAGNYTHRTATTEIHGVGSGTIVGTGLTQTLTDKTLTTPIIPSIYQDAGKTYLVTLPTSTDTLVGRDTTDILTSKTLTTPTIAAIQNGAYTLSIPTLSASDTIVGLASTQTMTNKTLTDPEIDTIINGGLTIALPTYVGDAEQTLAIEADLITADAFIEATVAGTVNANQFLGYMANLMVNNSRFAAMISENITVSYGTGAPASTPTSIGQIYVKTDATVAVYISTGTNSSADWTTVS